MRRLIALLLALITLLIPLTACGGGPADDDVSSSESEQAPPEEAEIVLPAASTLRGTVHMPPIGNQGGIGCCTSMGVTYMQFTIAVSQYLHAKDPDIQWDPSSGNEAYIFSPKFTYNLSGAGTAYAYEVLKDHGCLTMKDTFFETSNGAPTKEKNGRLSQKTASWDVEKGELQKALSYRILNYEEIENTSMQMGEDSALLQKIKEAIYKGNGVAFSCWSSNWRTAPINRSGTGEYGKTGDIAVYTSIDNTKFTESSEDASGNHCVCIIGYDDNITLTVGGVTLKGAFQVANSWGDGWANDGCIWMMYDAFNTKSEYEILNDGEFYSSTQHITPTDNGLKARNAEKGGTAQQLTFTKLETSAELGGNSYPLYTVSSEESGNLALQDGTLTFSKDAEGLGVAIIPFEEAFTLCKMTGSADDKAYEAYKGSYVLYAAGANEGGEPLFLRKVKKTSVDVTLGELNGGAESQNSCLNGCFLLEKYRASAEQFTCRASLASTKGKIGERTSTGYRFSFVYWDKDIVYGMPGAMIEVQLSSHKRDSVKLTVGRIDSTGNTVERVPAMFSYNATGTSHVYSDLASELTFSGKKSTESTVETAYFTVGCNEMADLVEGYDNENFLWTVDVAGNGVKVEKIGMRDGDGNLLFETTVPDSYPKLGKGESYSFVIDLGGELKEYSAEPEGTRRIVHQKSGLYLTKKGMLLEMQKEPSKEGRFDISLDSLLGYFLYVHGENHLVDISGKEITEGVAVKLNGRFDTRDTQTFDLLRQSDGSFMIALHADPSYVVCVGEDGNVVLGKAKTAGDSGLWRFESADDESGGIPISTAEENGKLTYTAVLPKNAGNALSVCVTDAEGKEIFRGDAEKSGENLTVSLPTLEKGTYLITTENGSKPAGKQTIFIVK